MKTDAEKLREMEEGIRAILETVKHNSNDGVSTWSGHWITGRLRALLPKRYKRPELVEKFKEWSLVCRPTASTETRNLLDACKAFIFEEEGE